MIDPEEFGKAMGGIVREAVEPLLKRIADLEAREVPDSKAIVDAMVVHDGLKGLVDLLVAESVEAIPKAIGEKGEPGKDGAGVADLLIDRDGALVATMTDGRMKSLGVVVGKDGQAGKDGQDLSDVSIDYDGLRTVSIKAKGGEIAKSYTIPLPMDAGYWSEGKACEKADVVTEGGNVWIALKNTKAKPCHAAKDDWRMFARAGRDGRDGRNGKDLGPAPPVKLEKS